MAAITAPTARKDGVTVNGKRSVDATFVSAGSTDTQTAAALGLKNINEVWLRVDGTTLMTAITAVGGLQTATWIDTAPAAVYRFIGD